MTSELIVLLSESIFPAFSLAYSETVQDTVGLVATVQRITNTVSPPINSAISILRLLTTLRCFKCLFTYISV